MTFRLYPNHGDMIPRSRHGGPVPVCGFSFYWNHDIPLNLRLAGREIIVGHQDDVNTNRFTDMNSK
jgi:hypothetical protein